MICAVRINGKLEEEMKRRMGQGLKKAEIMRHALYDYFELKQGLENND